MSAGRASNAERLRIEVASRAELRTWLAANHASSPSIWLVTGKKSTGDRYVPYDAIVDEALCFGWVDSVPRTLDADRSMRLLAPRKPGSGWSRVNKVRVARLIADGLMTDAGLKVIERAKADGSWAKLDKVETLAVPDDLAVALAAHTPAATHFGAFPKSSKRLILEWIENAKRPETRAARVQETARLAADNIRANHYRQPGGRG